MKRIAVIYQSKYGSTKQYAEWIAEQLGAELLPRAQVKPADLAQYDAVIYGGGLYAGGIGGADLVLKHPVKRLALFTVGLGDPKTADYTHVIKQAFPAGVPDTVKVFHLRGGVDYARLSFVHRTLMTVLKKLMIDKTPPEKRTDEMRTIQETYGKKADFTDRDSIAPIVAYVKSL